jgi:hypothetical protein
MEVDNMFRGRSEIEQVAQQEFAFLADQGFKPQRARSDIWGTTYSFAGDRIGFEVHLDFRDQAVDLDVVKLKDGKIPPPGRVDMTTRECIRNGVDLILRDRLQVQDEDLDHLFSLYRAGGWDVQHVTEIL